MGRLAVVALLLVGLTAVGLGVEPEEEGEESGVVTGAISDREDPRLEEEPVTSALSGQWAVREETLVSSRIQAERFRPEVVESALLEVRAPSQRFAAHRGAGTRITTFPGTFAPRRLLPRHKYGPWSIGAGLSLSQNYTDNVFLGPSNKESELTTLVTPRFEVAWSQPNGRVALLYGGQFFRPHRFSENQRENHQIALEGQWKIRSSLTARVGYVYGLHTVSASYKGGGHTGYQDDTAMLGLTYAPWGGWELDMSYDRYQARFPDVSSDNVIVNGFGLTVSRRVAATVWAQGRLRYASTDNQDVGGPNTDNDTYTASVGLRFDPTAPLSGTVHVGCSKKEFESAGFPRQDSLYVRAGVGYSPRTWAHLFWTADRSVLETSVTALNAPSGATYQRTSTSLGARFDVTRRWGFGVRGFYSLDEYPGASARKDDLCGANVSAFYDLNEWCRMRLNYQYQQNDSNVNSRDYAENSVNLGLELDF